MVRLEGVEIAVVGCSGYDIIEFDDNVENGLGLKHTASSLEWTSGRGSGRGGLVNGLGLDGRIGMWFGDEL